MRGGESAEAASDVPVLAQHPQRKVALLVEPTPFTHVSGYCNRFKEMLRYLKEGGDEVKVVTTDDTEGKPGDFLGMPITYVPGFRLILYKQVGRRSAPVPHSPSGCASRAFTRFLHFTRIHKPPLPTFPLPSPRRCS